VPTKAHLTSADLAEIRETVLGAADPLGVAADLADAADAGRLADPEDAGKALMLAAEIAESRSKLEAALRYADRAVKAPGGGDAATALHARILFRSGRADEAMAELEPLRPRLTTDPDAAAYLSVALSVGGRNRVAEEWLTGAVQAVLDERQAAEPATAEDAGLLFFLLQQRHRIRHALNLPHDAHDNLAERLETRLANAAAPPAADRLFWPRSQFDRLLEKWPALAESYGRDWDEHRARLERELVRTGGPLKIGSVAALTAGGDPADPTVRAAYAASAPAVNWPPERNDPCWCGSGDKYKKCCRPRSQ
jgi:tetratricopeptide (TPR) repeat protein